MSATPVLELRAVRKSFAGPGGPVQVLRDASLRIHRGEFVMVAGPSGSGKTTLLNLAGLLDSPTAGDLLFDGIHASQLGETERCRLRCERIGMVFQKFVLLPHRTALENVLFRFRYCGGDSPQRREHASTVMADMGIAELAERRARVLSQGEMQRVAIARAVVHPPALLLADEPTGNLDAAAALSVMDCFRRLHGAGMTILMVTHNSSLLQYASRCVVCRDGELAAA
jgi:putative ABC transport system ATP-binding protein